MGDRLEVGWPTAAEEGLQRKVGPGSSRDRPSGLRFCRGLVTLKAEPPPRSLVGVSAVEQPRRPAAGQESCSHVAPGCPWTEATGTQRAPGHDGHQPRGPWGRSRHRAPWGRGPLPTVAGLWEELGLSLQRPQGACPAHRRLGAAQGGCWPGGRLARRHAVLRQGGVAASRGAQAGRGGGGPGCPPPGGDKPLSLLDRAGQQRV